MLRQMRVGALIALGAGFNPILTMLISKAKRIMNMEKILSSPQGILELIRKQPPMTSERFWMQVEKAQEFSPNEEPCSNGRSEQEEDTAKASG